MCEMSRSDTRKRNHSTEETRIYLDTVMPVDRKIKIGKRFRFLLHFVKKLVSKIYFPLANYI